MRFIIGGRLYFFLCYLYVICYNKDIYDGKLEDANGHHFLKGKRYMKHPDSMREAQVLYARIESLKAQLHNSELKVTLLEDKVDTLTLKLSLSGLPDDVMADILEMKNNDNI